MQAAKKIVFYDHSLSQANERNLFLSFSKLSHILILVFLVFLTNTACFTKTQSPLHPKNAHHQLTRSQQKKMPPHTKITPKQVGQKRVIVKSIAQSSPVSKTLLADKRLAQYVHNLVLNLNYSSYKLGGTLFDTTRGVYVLDCSSYVDHLLKKTYPDAFRRLVKWSQSKTPTTYHFYHFFNQLSEKSQRYWSSISNVEKLKAGDILVFRKAKSSQNVTGHIMIVMDKPVRHNNMFTLKIADSAPFRHSQDTRSINVSGIGIGTMLLKVNPKTAEPQAYAWTVGSNWKKNVVFAMARPVDLTA